MTRITKPTGDVPVPQSKDEANDYIARIGDHQRRRAEIEVQMNDEIEPIRAKHEAAAKEHSEAVTALTEGVFRWAEANRDRLTNGGKTKTANLAAGIITWRLRPPKVTIRGKDAVIEALERLGLVQFLRIKTDVDKEAILSDPAAVQDIKGVTVGSAGEDFGVRPHETELEEVTT